MRQLKYSLGLGGAEPPQELLEVFILEETVEHHLHAAVRFGLPGWRQPEGYEQNW